jgi:SET domain-containing protein
MNAHFPHYDVYTRIARSKVHGVGVIAVRNIPKGTYIFFGDNDRLRWIKASKVKRLPIQIKRLYKDFCIRKGELYGCPTNFNKMTPAWYLNHSKTPNVAADKAYRFYALRNIKTGEELFADYKTYSE